MTSTDLREKLEKMLKQRNELVAAVKQLDGAIGFCKGLIDEIAADGNGQPADRLNWVGVSPATTAEPLPEG